MRIERKGAENNILIYCRNGGCAFAVYECFRRVNNFGSEIDEGDDCILAMSDYFDFDIILKIREGYVYCEVHTNTSGNHSYTVVYSFDDLKRDVVFKLNELVFNTDTYAQLNLKEKRIICSCVAWFYNDIGEDIPNKPYGFLLDSSDVQYDIYSKTREGIKASGVYLDDTYSGLLNITLWSMASTDIAISIMNFDADIIALYSVVDGVMLGIRPNSNDDILQCFCELIRLSLEVKSGYRNIIVESDAITIIEPDDNVQNVDTLTNEQLIEMGYNLDKFEDFERLYKSVAVCMGMYDFDISDFNIARNASGELSVSKFFKITGGELV